MEEYICAQCGQSVDAGLLHNGEEFVFTDLAVAVLVKLVDHRLQLVVAQVLAQLARHSAQIAQTDAARVVLVEELERLEDFLYGVPLRNFGGHYLQEVWVLDLSGPFAVVVAHDSEDLLLLDIESEGAHSDLELVVVDSAGLVGVEELESLLDLLLLLISELRTAAAFNWVCASAKELGLLEHFNYLNSN